MAQSAMSNRAAKNDRMKLVWHIEIVDESSFAAEEALVFDPLDRTTNDSIS
jgi:hypothetical protein